jgi:hypothetical protein
MIYYQVIICKCDYVIQNRNGGLSFTSTDFFDSLAIKSEFLKAEILTICKTYVVIHADE